MSNPGRSCPLHYRYAPEELARTAELGAEILYVVGGLYGNGLALERILRLAAREPAPVALVFNGDFNWFNTDDDGFQAINRAVLEHWALRGNVETELSDEENEAGCGCGYPEWVDDGVVARSNSIMEQLRETARHFPHLCRRLRTLPSYRVAVVGDLRIGIVHGDAESLAGWRFSQESLAASNNLGWLGEVFRQARVQLFASTHTCLPVLKSWQFPEGRRAVINNGAAGMPNFRHSRYGVITRIATLPYAPGTLYGTTLKGVRVDALAVDYDQAAWHKQFLANWPPGSPAYESYFQRMMRGPDYGLEQALRTDVCCRDQVIYQSGQ